MQTAAEADRLMEFACVDRLAGWALALVDATCPGRLVHAKTQRREGKNDGNHDSGFLFEFVEPCESPPSPYTLHLTP